MKITATASKDKLTYKGYLWESRLVAMGWNNLPTEKRRFELLNWCPRTGTYGARFQDYTFICYRGEIKEIKEEITDEN